ncbi:hypothetical protein [Methylobacterium dankookense]|uniref:Uncharacterized protein n=1 Tax=Methylobacterium dankookense TaxID=560405 RepID=A0A564G5W8_9HYPH|nr:hypothetical protein [Methylobacterium dankookense]GJD59616.1 hypothetical protein IFDJLNFL_5545 [Methylobacterium dankookense]VUF15943.1 hypothetical protein MTDSW087_05692 [Methylobacterium dankookense]
MAPFKPTHVSHKQVEAYQIQASNFDETGAGKVALTGGATVIVPPGFASRGAPAKGDMLVRYAPTETEPDGYLSHSPRAVFEDGYRKIGQRGPVLMSASNPTGWKLEELVDQLLIELNAKNARISEDPSAAAVIVRGNNAVILCLLDVIGAYQRGIVTTLDGIGPDQGPKGRPRIGADAGPVQQS